MPIRKKLLDFQPCYLALETEAMELSLLKGAGAIPSW
jgi:hypothetical protein